MSLPLVPIWYTKFLTRPNGVLLSTVFLTVFMPLNLVPNCQKRLSPSFHYGTDLPPHEEKPVDTTYIHSIQSERYKVKGNIQSYCMVKATVLSLATEMAFHMGFSEIYLLGVDCTNPHGKGGHFTDNYATKEVAETDINRIKTRMKMKSMTTQQIGEHIIDRSMEVYSLLHDYAEKKGFIFTMPPGAAIWRFFPVLH